MVTLTCSFVVRSGVRSTAIEKRFDIHPCGRIIEFASGGCPYKEHLYELEEEQVRDINTLDLR